MKKRGTCFLLVVLLCLCVLAGCGGGGESRKLPIDFQMSKMDLTLKNYAIVNQRVSGGYEISGYVLYEFPGNDVITAEEIEWLFNKTGLEATGYYSYVDENEPENTRIGAQLGREEGDQPTRESYFDAIWSGIGAYNQGKSSVIIGEIDKETGRRSVAVGGVLESDDEPGS